MSDDQSSPFPSREEDPFVPFYDWFNHGSDRPLAITLPALLEELLQELLRQKMRPDKEIAAEFFRPSGPLGNYGAKVRMAYMLGIIDTNVYKDLVTIGKIRNRFAHQIDVPKFKDPTIKKWIESMYAYKTLREIADQELTGDEPDYDFLHAMKFTIGNNLSEPNYSFRECVRFYARAMHDVAKTNKEAIERASSGASQAPSDAS